MTEVAGQEEVLGWLAAGVQITALSIASGWPPRQILLLGFRNGYLFTPNGTPYKAPEGRTRSARSQRPRPRP